MLLCETMLLAVMSGIAYVTILTDVKRGKIENKTLAIAVIIIMVINAVYYCCFSQEYRSGYFVNLCSMAVVSVALFLFNIWSAGDSKLLIVMTMAYPMRLYIKGWGGMVPALGCIVAIFLSAYLYVLLDSIIHFIRKERFYKRKIDKAYIISFIKRYIINLIYLQLVSSISMMILGEFYFRNQMLFVFFNLFFVIYISEKELFERWYVVACALSAGVLLNAFATWGISIKSFILLSGVLILRYFISGYNYVEIDIENVKPGMVMSFGTIMAFSKSRIQGLPESTDETVRARITEEEAASIKRWGSSKNGSTRIVVVRTMPFSIFIVLGEFLYFVFRMIVWKSIML